MLTVAEEDVCYIIKALRLSGEVKPTLNRV